MSIAPLIAINVNMYTIKHMGQKLERTRTITPADITAAARLRSIWTKKKKELGLTQEKAAQLFGDITQGAISQYLNGRIVIGPVATLKFARILDVNPTDIRPDFEFKVIPGDLPQDVIETAIKLATLPLRVRQDFSKLVDTMASTSYENYLSNVDSHNTEKA